MTASICCHTEESYPEDIVVEGTESKREGRGSLEVTLAIEATVVEAVEPGRHVGQSVRAQAPAWVVTLKQ